MAAAYAALTSLKNTINNLHNHPSPPIPTDKQQVRSLTEVVTFLQEFLRGYNSSFAYSDEADPLEIRIMDAAFKAEDGIECKIVDQIRSKSTTAGSNHRDELHQHLQLVIEEMDQIKGVAVTTPTENTAVRPQLRTRVSTDIGSSTSSSSSSMVGFDDAVTEVLESLVRSQRDLQIIPITGMGGIGKTTLARNLFENALVKEQFNIRAWTAISQDFNARQALKELLSQAKGYSSGESEDELGLQLYQYLSGRRYLIVLDDMWSIDVWNKVRHYFPDYNNGSRVIVTTRQSNLASHLKNGFKMKFLDEGSSWNLFSKTVFGEESFPLELEEIGKKIVRNCRGLPISIVTVGGLLAKSKQTREYWEHIEENLNPMVNSEDDEHCLRILKMSYNYLPIHLKPCFLCMGVFEEDRIIYVSGLIQWWISEGFLEPTSDKCLETIASENLRELVDRNLILVDKLMYNGDITSCKIHDLLRDLCIREAKKCGFYVYVGEHIPQGINSMCRIVNHRNISNEELLDASKSLSGAISVTYDNAWYVTIIPYRLRLWKKIVESPKDQLSSRDFLEFAVNCRYLNLSDDYLCPLISSLNLFWNLHTLISSRDQRVDAPIGIWSMPHLRHVNLREMCLPDPPTDHVVIMENLQIVEMVKNLKLNQEVVKRIPNIKKLYVEYDEMEPKEDYYCLNNLECLNKLEIFKCDSKDLEVDGFMKELTFPQSLKTLELLLSDSFELEEMFEKVGALPLLQSLYVRRGYFKTGEWRTVEGQFCRLEVLTLHHCCGLERWTSESSHFPLLKEIYFESLEELEEIPLEIGDIPALQKITLYYCSMSSVMYAKKIVEEQEESQGEEQLSFKVRVLMQESRFRCSESTGRCGEREPHFHSRLVKEEAERLNGPNFHIVLVP